MAYIFKAEYLINKFRLPLPDEGNQIERLCNDNEDKLQSLFGVDFIDEMKSGLNKTKESALFFYGGVLNGIKYDGVEKIVALLMVSDFIITTSINVSNEGTSEGFSMNANKVNNSSMINDYYNYASSIQDNILGYLNDNKDPKKYTKFDNEIVVKLGVRDDWNF